MQKLSYSQRLYYESKTKLIVIPSLVIALGMIVLYFSAPLLFKSTTILLSVVSFYFGYFVYPYVSKKIQALDKKFDTLYEKHIEDPLFKDLDSAKMGTDGEKIVFEWLDQILHDGRWCVFKNQEFIGMNGNKFDVDAVAIGPMGIFVFEIKNSSYDFLFTTEDCRVLVGEQYLRYAGRDPRIQVGQNSETIEKHLKIAGLNNIRVKRAVVFARSNSMRFLGKPTVFLIDNKDSLRRYLLESPEDARFTSEFCEKAKKAILMTPLT